MLQRRTACTALVRVASLPVALCGLGFFAHRVGDGLHPPQKKPLAAQPHSKRARPQQVLQAFLQRSTQLAGACCAACASNG
jgi:hypothetical protein